MLHNREPVVGQVGSVLWLDDDVKHFVAQKTKLQSRGIHIYEAETTSTAYEILADSSDVHLCIVDLKLETQQEGIQFIELVHEKHPEVSFLVYSNYAHLPSHISRLQTLENKLAGRLWNLPKGRVPSPNTNEFDAAFIDPVEQIIRKGKPTSEVVTTFRSSPTRKGSQFDISLSEYLSVPMESRMQLLSDFRTRHDATIEQLFHEGYVWVLFLGDDDKPYKKEKDRRNVLSESAITKLAQQTKKVPFHFFSDSIADDFDKSSACSASSEARGYPTLVIEFREHSFEVHFDTGLYQTHFDRGFCEHVGLTGILLFPGLGRMIAKATPGMASTRKDYGASYFSTEAFIQKKTSGEAFPISLSGIAMLNWAKSPFYRDCYTDCTYYKRSDYPNGGNVSRRNLDMCAFRDGLLGRTLMEDNIDLRITLQHGKTDIDYGG